MTAGSDVFTKDMKTTKLTISNATENLILSDTKELGAAIHSEALAREKKVREDRVIAEVQRLESARLDYARQAAFATAASNWYAAKLDAINAGEFKFDLVHAQMIFDNPEFNRGNY
jgi:hypothetical protein